MKKFKSFYFNKSILSSLPNPFRNRFAKVKLISKLANLFLNNFICIFKFRCQLQYYSSFVLGLQIYAPISRFSKPILQLFYIKTLTDCYDGKYLWKIFYNTAIGRVFYRKKWGLKRFTFIFSLMKKREKILRQAQNDKKILTLVSFWGWDAETSSARLDN